MSSYIALVIGAVIGASLRYLISLFNIILIGIPFTTIIVNVIGSGLAGFFLNKFNGNFYIFFYIGLFGSFTTLSAFNLELFNLMNNQEFTKAFIFFILNIVVSFLIFYSFYILNLKLEN